MEKSIRLLFFGFMVYFATAACAQDHSSHFHGRVMAAGEGRPAPLAFANVFWAGTTQGAVTDAGGQFHIDYPASGERRLVASFVGYGNDTILVETGMHDAEFLLVPLTTRLGLVEISERQEKSFVSKLTAIKSEHITTAGLQQLACCNLSESFENSATVDVGYADAISGARQIQMLGLAGVYSQMMFENMPFLRGLAAPYGLGFVPGTWMQSIQVSKGTASVINGYESVTGQINVEYKKPEHFEDHLQLNLYGSNEGRAEVNFLAHSALSPSLTTLVLGHASMLQTEHDQNQDGFMDMPRSRQINLMNRWTYEYGQRGHTRFEINALHEDRFGGSTGAYGNPQWREQGLFAADIRTRRYQAFLKTGFLLDDHGHNSIGIQATANIHDHDSRFGDRTYHAEQESAYGNVILQLEPGHSGMHKISTGASFQYDHYTEHFMAEEWKNRETVPGVFAQYTFEWGETLTLLAGLRTDFHNLSGTLLTPRFHLRWQSLPSLVVRASAGKGYRSPVILAENIGYLSSSREIVFNSREGIESAWNYGVNLTQTWEVDDKRKVELTLDFYRTSFLKQWVADAEQSARRVVFVYSDGTSYSNSFQAELRFEPVSRLSILAAFRLNDVKTTLNNELKEKPFVFKYKGLANLSYATRFEKWQFDFTGLLNAGARLPYTGDNPVAYQRPDKVPAHVIMHAQVTRRFKNLDLYAGSENLGGFVQDNPVVDPGNPYGPYFDASMVWGPVSGRMIYAGLRYNIKRQ